MKEILPWRDVISSNKDQRPVDEFPELLPRTFVKEVCKDWNKGTDPEEMSREE